MKALSLCQPYAALVALGAKEIETRSWSTAYRGPLVIHAAKGEPWKLTPEQQRAMLLVREQYPQADFNVRGCLIATCTLYGCVKIGEHGALESSLFIREMDWGDYTPGRYAWLLKNVRAIAPIPCRGALGLFEVPDGLVSEAHP